jgi:LAO/AO transport system kinase
VSALSGEGIPGLKDHVEQLLQGAGSSGLLAARRSQQNLHWMDRSMVDGLRDRLEQDAPVRALRDALEQQVAAGTLSPFDAAEQVVALFRTDGAPRP